MDKRQAMKRALHKNTSLFIESGIFSNSLAHRLLSAELISGVQYNRYTDGLTGKDSASRLQEMMKAVTASVGLDVGYFSTFVQVLRKGGPVEKKIADELEDSYESLLKEEQQKVMTSPSLTGLNTSMPLNSDSTIVEASEKTSSSVQNRLAVQKMKDLPDSSSSDPSLFEPQTCTVIGPAKSTVKSQEESIGKYSTFKCSTETFLEIPKSQIRHYQWELAEPGFNGENYIICAPTGSGKTLVAALIIKDHLVTKQKAGKVGKVLFIVKTQQLAHQQKNKLDEYLGGISVIEITGETESPIYSTLPQVDIVVCTSGKLCSELQNGFIHISAASLLILDECHHAVGGDAYAIIMEHYLLQKRQGCYPHVIGMTASPGAGRGKYPTMAKVIAHQTNLCARLDATSGVKCVQANENELLTFIHPPNHTSHPLPQRNRMDPFIQLSTNVMMQLEKMLPVPSIPTFGRNSLAYQQWIKNEIDAAQLSGMEGQRDQIGILELLEACVLALVTYEDFEIENAMEILEEVDYGEDNSLNGTEKRLKQIYSQLKHDLSQISGYPNHLLKKAEDLLYHHFSSKPDSKGLFFVRAIKHTEYVTEWIRASPKLASLIKPASITGYSRKGMSKEEQIAVIEKFRSGEVNLLISTSVLEEGLDIPDCNLVIRFQIMSNEVADVQAQGRARAEDSTMHTIIVSNSHIHHNQLINKDKKDLAIKAVKCLSKKSIDLPYMERLQDDILHQREQRIKAEEERKKIWNIEDVNVLCRKCGSFACYATSICKYGTNPASPHYIISSQSFIKEKMKKIKRNRPEPATVADFSRPHKIGCVVCSDEWGVWGCWKNCVQYPVLRCKSFIFYNRRTKQRENCKQWKVIPFDIPFYNEYIELEEDN